MTNKDKFNGIIKFAKDLIDTTKEYSEFDKNITNNPHPIIDVIKILGRKIQDEYFTSLLGVNEESRLPNISVGDYLFSEFYIISEDGLTFDKVKREVDRDIELDLSRDLLLPWPWKRIRLLRSLASIGKGRLNGEWTYHSNNHHVIVWLPLGIGWVEGGNHSMTVGILQGQGKLTPKLIYDISEIYNYVYCDGENFIRKDNGEIICPINSVEFAAIFEIGRLMMEHSISAF